VLPLDVVEYGISLDNSLGRLKRVFGAELRKNKVTLTHIEDAIEK
jgi:hypothetical protein